MSSNKDFLPSSSPISSICAIEIEAILFLFMMNCYKSSFQECITIIVLKIEPTRNQPPYCLLQLQEKMVFRLPRSGCLGTPLTLPQSLYGRTDGRTLTSEPKFFGSTGYQICLPMVLRELRYKLELRAYFLPTLYKKGASLLIKKKRILYNAGRYTYRKKLDMPTHTHARYNKKYGTLTFIIVYLKAHCMSVTRRTVGCIRIQYSGVPVSQTPRTLT